MYVSKRIGLTRYIFHERLVILSIALVVVLVSVVHIAFLDTFLRVSMAVAAVGTAVSFFIGFFTAQAYDRWWEARKIWGQFVNDSRSFGRMVLSFFAHLETASGIAPIQDRLIRRHIAYLYAVKAHLRNEEPRECLALLNAEDRTPASEAKHLGNVLLTIQGQELDAAEREGLIDVIRLAQLNEMLTSFSNSMGAAERIKTTVFPPVYPAMIRASIWAYIVVFALALSEFIGYWAMPYVFVVGVIFHLVYDAGRMLLDPFENRPNDIPMSSIVRTIEINLLEQLGEKGLPSPVEPVEGRYLM